jgi:hypothetical protein
MGFAGLGLPMPVSAKMLFSPCADDVDVLDWACAWAWVWA